MRVAIIGAGMAGLSCAERLAQFGHEVSLFDKGRGAGGRMSTRRIETQMGAASFDHGAQYFTVRDQGFAKVVADWSAKALAAPWPEAGLDAWVGVPGMSAVIREMANRQNVEFGFLAKGLVRDGFGWSIVGELETRGVFDAVVVATPAEQASSILALHDFDMARSALLARSQPCWTVMLAFATPAPAKSNIIRDRGPIAWAARNSAKPGRETVECWVIQGTATWSTAQIDEAADSVITLLKNALENEIGAPIPEILFSAAHRWRYALSSGAGLGALWNKEIGLGVCGDWLVGPRVECAWLSGQELAEKIARAGLDRNHRIRASLATPPQTRRALHLCDRRKVLLSACNGRLNGRLGVGQR